MLYFVMVGCYKNTAGYTHRLDMQLYGKTRKIIAWFDLNTIWHRKLGYEDDDVVYNIVYPFFSGYVTYTHANKFSFS